MLMSSSKEITELRKSGKLKEALEMSVSLLEAEPDNIWNKRAAAWVYYEFLKSNIIPNQSDTFIEYLEKVKSLALTNEETMLFENIGWQIGSLVMALQKEKTVDYNTINRVFSIITDFYFVKPSKSYSFIYKAFHKNYENWSNYIEFADWWNFENFAQ